MEENNNKVPLIILIFLLGVLFFELPKFGVKTSDIIGIMIIVALLYWAILPSIKNLFPPKMEKRSSVKIDSNKNAAPNALLSDEDWSNLSEEELQKKFENHMTESRKVISNTNKDLKKINIITVGIVAIFIILNVIVPLLNFVNSTFFNTTSAPTGNNTPINNLQVAPPKTQNSNIPVGNPALNYSNLLINPLSEYNYKSKNEIYAIRKNHVMNSLFASSNYQPSEEVFGQMEDGKPWDGMGLFPCKTGDVVKGVTYRSKFINNPAILIDVSNDIAYPYNKNEPICRDTKTWTLLADKLVYSQQQNMVTVTYKVDNTFLRNNTLKGSPTLDFGAINARDFGYDYGYVAKYNNLGFDQTNNISTAVYQFKDFIHTGSSCGVPGGCNNQSPWQKEVDFHLTSLPASATFKLWKKEPLTADDRPDIYFTVVLENKN